MPTLIQATIDWTQVDFSKFTPEIEVIAEPPCTRHNRIPDEFLPDILAAIPMEAEISISRSFEEHPSANFTFVTYRSLKKDILSALRIGTILTLFELDFVIENLTFKEEKISELPQDLIGVQCSLTGVWEKALTKKIALVDFVDSVDKIHPECLQKLPRISKKTKVKLASLAQKAGTKFSGKGSHWWIKVAPYIDPNTTITLEDVLSGLLAINGCFRFYSNPRQIEAKRLWQTHLWQVPEGDISSEINTQIKGDYYHSDRFDPENKNFYLCETVGLGTTKPVIPSLPPLTEEDLPWPLGDIWYPAKQITFPEEAEDTLPERKDKRLPAEIQKGTFEVSSGDEDAETPPPSDGGIKDVGLCYPNGPTKVKVTTTMKGDVEIEKRTQVYGYLFYGRDCWRWTETGWFNRATNPQWIVCEETVVTQQYGNYGYHLGFKSEGWRMTRYRDESSGGTVPETAIIQEILSRAIGDMDDMMSQDHIGKLLVDLDAKEVYDAIEAFVVLSKQNGLTPEYVKLLDEIYSASNRFGNWNYNIGIGNPSNSGNIDSIISGIRSRLFYETSLLEDSIKDQFGIMTNVVRIFVNLIAPLYEFRIVPIFEQEAKELHPFKNAYADAERPSKFGEAYIKCLPNGQATYAVDVENQDVVPLYYVKKKSHFKTEYSTVFNPEFYIQNWVNMVLKMNGVEIIPKDVPESIKKGDEMYVVSDFKPYEKKDFKVFPTVKKDFYKEYISKWTANPDGNSTNVTSNSYQGRLSLAERMPKEFEELKEDDEPQKVENKTAYKHYAVSRSYSQNHKLYVGLMPVNLDNSDFAVAETIDYENAQNIREAKTGAETDYELSNIRSGPSESLNLVFDPKYLKIKEGDRFDYILNNEIRRRIVTGISFSVAFQGIANQRPLVTCDKISLQLVPRRKLPLTWHKVKDTPVELDIKKIAVEESFVYTIIKSEAEIWRSRLSPNYNEPD